MKRKQYIGKNKPKFIKINILKREKNSNFYMKMSIKKKEITDTSDSYSVF